jgi:hypothetical protein
VTQIDPTRLRTLPRRKTRLTEESQELLKSLRRKSNASGRLSPRTYNLTISHTHRFLWYRNAKVGTRTFFTYLKEHDVRAEMLHASRTPYPTEVFRDYYKFGFVRHPLDRFISAWQDKVHDRNSLKFDEPTLEKMKTIENFAAWVADHDLRDLGSTDRHVVLQTRLIDLTEVDFVGRMDTFGEDLATVCRTIGIPVDPPARRNKSTAQGVTRENASPELRRKVEEMYRLDYQVFGYDG